MDYELSDAHKLIRVTAREMNARERARYNRWRRR